MTELLEKAMAAVRRWPAEQQDEAAEILLALGALGSGSYRASEAELRAVDEAMAQVAREEYATDAEVEAAFARFRT